MLPLGLFSEFLLDINTSVIIDCKSPAKVLLKIEESIYMEMNLNVQ